MAHLSDKVVEKVLDRIQDNAIEPGTPLIEKDLAKALGVSRTPVREALRKLEAEGLLVNVGSRSVVRSLSLRELAQLYDVRGVLEGLAARTLSARRRPPELIEKLEGIVAEFEKMEKKEPENLGKRQAIDQEFHSLIVNSCDNAELQAILRSRMCLLYLFVLRSTVVATDKLGSGPAYPHDHRGIVEAIKDGNADQAETRMRKHIENGKRELVTAALQ